MNSKKHPILVAFFDFLPVIYPWQSKKMMLSIPRTIPGMSMLIVLSKHQDLKILPFVLL
jgi:hypothetical protein